MGKNRHKPEYINREISWLAFNERVLQEAQDKSVPLVERMRSLGIFSNNLDEFFKVRVATLQRATRISKNPIDPMDFDPEETLTHIHQAVVRLQEKFDRTFSQVAAELAKEDVHFVDETRLGDAQKLFVEAYFEKKVRPYLVPLMLNNKRPFPQMYRKFKRHFRAATPPHASAGSRPSLALPERRTAKRSAAQRGLDMLRRMGEAEAARVPWGEGLGKGGCTPAESVYDQHPSPGSHDEPGRLVPHGKNYRVLSGHR